MTPRAWPSSARDCRRGSAVRPAGPSAAGPATAPRRRRCCRRPLTSDLVEQRRLMPGAPRRGPLAHERVVVEVRVERVAGDVRDLRAAARRRPARDRQAAEHPLVDEPQLSARRRPKVEPRPAGALVSGSAPVGCTSSWPLMPRWPSSASPLSSGEPEVLAAPPGAVDHGGRSERAAKSSAPGQVAAHRRGDAGRRPRRSCADDVALQAGPDDLDLGQLGHGLGLAVGCRCPAARAAGRCQRARVPVRRLRVRPASSRRQRQAASAACCSASFLERPMPLP